MGLNVRLRLRSFQALALCMSALGVVIGLIFPPFVIAIQVATPAAAGAIGFRLVCLLAGQLLAVANYALVRVVVGKRLRQLAAQMRDTSQLISTAGATGKWVQLELRQSQILVGADDELGRPAAAFNSLIVELERSLDARQRLEEELRHQAFHDPLTGLANRALFLEHSQTALAHLERRSGSLAVLFLDLDGFKAVNDELGHAAGDAVLVEMAVRLRQICRAHDTVSRLGGDEFAVLCTGVDIDLAHEVADRLISGLSEPILLDGRRITVGASVGIAVSATSTTTADQLLRRADEAMYLVKKTKGKHGLARQHQAAVPGPDAR